MSLAGFHLLRPTIAESITLGLPITRLDVSDPQTMERWCATPDYDTRTLEEFAADGGYPAGPPNRIAPTGNTGTR
jgi:hypothetical protein